MVTTRVKRWPWSPPELPAGTDWCWNYSYVEELIFSIHRVVYEAHECGRTLYCISRGLEAVAAVFHDEIELEKKIKSKLLAAEQRYTGEILDHMRWLDAAMKLFCRFGADVCGLDTTPLQKAKMRASKSPGSIYDPIAPLLNEIGAHAAAARDAAIAEARRRLPVESMVKHDPLSARARAVLQHLESLPVNTAITGPEIVEWLNEQGDLISESTLTSRVIPELKRFGVKNKRRIGYFIDRKARIDNH